MQIATWNINGVKARLETARTWLADAQPDIACLQEIKSIDENFPSEIFEELGYNVVTHGQKSFNGVAILSKLPFDETIKRLPGDDSDEQSRYLEAVVSTPNGALRVASIYLPNGNPLGTEKYPYKLAWMERLHAHAKSLLANEEMIVLAGDYNVIANDGDVYNPQAWQDDALFQPETRAAFRAMINLGYTEAISACSDAPGQYTFWDYQAGAWPKNNGIRIDHLLLSPLAADRLQGAWIDQRPRGWEKPSDHTPVLIEIDISER